MSKETQEAAISQLMLLTHPFAKAEADRLREARENLPGVLPNDIEHIKKIPDITSWDSKEGRAWIRTMGGGENDPKLSLVRECAHLRESVSTEEERNLATLFLQNNLFELANRDDNAVDFVATVITAKFPEMRKCTLEDLVFFVRAAIAKERHSLSRVLLAAEMQQPIDPDEIDKAIHRRTDLNILETQLKGLLPTAMKNALTQ